MFRVLMMITVYVHGKAFFQLGANRHTPHTVEGTHAAHGTCGTSRAESGRSGGTPQTVHTYARHESLTSRPLDTLEWSLATHTGRQFEKKTETER